MTDTKSASRTSGITRRDAVRLGAAATALPLVHIRSAGAAGKLLVGFWDHWVPKGDEILRKQIQTWADKNKVDVQIDFITSVGNKLVLTAAAEAQAGNGHDMLQFVQYDIHNYADKLEPVDDVIKAITDQYGPYDKASEYLGKVKGHWAGVPTSTATACRPTLARISLMKQIGGIDVQALYPPHEVTAPEGADWTYETFIKAGEACKKAGYGYGLGVGNTGDSVGNASTLFAAFDAHLVDEKGNNSVDSDNVHAVLEFGQKFVQILPKDALSYDDASDNRLMIAGKTALIFDPPSPYAVAKRDAPHIAEDMWSFPNPAGPAGRFIPYVYAFSGIWQFSQNKSAAKDLSIYLSQRPQFEERTRAVEGFDIPVLMSMSDSAIWAEVAPPKGVMFNYPLRPWHNAKPCVPGYPAPPEIAAQMVSRATHPKMLAKLYTGQSIKEVIAWAKDEVEGYTM